MAPRKPSKPKKPGEWDRKPRPKLRLEPSGRPWEGAAVRACVRTGVRVAVWTTDRMGHEDPPAHVGVLLGLLSDRAGPVRLAVAVNDRIEKPALADVGYVIELNPRDPAPPGVPEELLEEAARAS